MFGDSRTQGERRWAETGLSLCKAGKGPGGGKGREEVPVTVTNYPSLPENVQMLDLQILCPRKPISSRKAKAVGWLPYTLPQNPRSWDWQWRLPNLGPSFPVQGPQFSFSLL